MILTSVLGRICATVPGTVLVLVNLYRTAGALEAQMCCPKLKESRGSARPGQLVARNPRAHLEVVSSDKRGGNVMNRRAEVRRVERKGVNGQRQRSFACFEE